jgi:hypothetical protein
MPMTTVDRRRWRQERMRFLRERLDAGPADDERAAIEAELAALRRDAGGSSRFFRWLFGTPRMPGR